MGLDTDIETPGAAARQNPGQNPDAPARIWRDGDLSLAPLKDKTVAVIGYGNQGQAQALNLKDSGLRVRVGGRAKSTRLSVARDDGFDTGTVREVAEASDVLMLLTPDEAMGELFEKELSPVLKPRHYLGFGHGLAIHAGWVRPPQSLNVFLVAPKGQARGVRQKFLAGGGVPALVGVAQDPSGDTWPLALAYAKALGSARAGVMPTTFEEEAVCDLFSEQAVLCGGLTRLIQAAFETLIEAGYAPEAAYLECLYEVKLIADLLHEKGIAGMRQGISSTALFGDLTQGDRVVDAHVRGAMRGLLADIRSGRYAETMAADARADWPERDRRLAEAAGHPIEAVHQRLRARMHL